jgi:branched-chain amino acid transport system permease protein
MGTMPGLKAFVAAVLGGIGSVPGAMLGGYILGISETMTKGFLSSQYADAISFSILIIILLVKPTGIMGKNVREKV